MRQRIARQHIESMAHEKLPPIGAGGPLLRRKLRLL